MEAAVPDLPSTPFAALVLACEDPDLLEAGGGALFFVPAGRAQAAELRNLAHVTSMGIAAASRAWDLSEEVFPAVSLYSQPARADDHHGLLLRMFTMLPRGFGTKRVSGRSSLLDRARHDCSRLSVLAGLAENAAAGQEA